MSVGCSVLHSLSPPIPVGGVGGRAVKTNDWCIWAAGRFARELFRP